MATVVGFNDVKMIEQGAKNIVMDIYGLYKNYCHLIMFIIQFRNYLFIGVYYIILSQIKLMQRIVTANINYQKKGKLATVGGDKSRSKGQVYLSSVATSIIHKLDTLDDEIENDAKNIEQCTKDVEM